MGRLITRLAALHRRCPGGPWIKGEWESDQTAPYRHEEYGTQSVGTSRSVARRIDGATKPQSIDDEPRNAQDLSEVVRESIECFC